jgi:hypothetical protein
MLSSFAIRGIVEGANSNVGLVAMPPNDGLSFSPDSFFVLIKIRRTLNTPQPKTR